jgi:ribonuclease HII
MKNHSSFLYFCACPYQRITLLIVTTILLSQRTQAFFGPIHYAQPIQRIEALTELYVKNKNKSNRRRKSNDVLSIEKELEGRGFTAIIGTDETGRGSVAGPVLSASCCVLIDDWSKYTAIEGVADSKTLSAEERERIYTEVVNNPDIYAWETAQRTNEEIDNSNILLATMECFQESIEKVVSKLPKDSTPYSIVDGKKSPKLTLKVPCRSWVKGDAEVYTVSLASILARVTIDRLSTEWHENYPEYGFDQHKGYATKNHVEAIHRHGPSPLHRLSFKSLKGRSNT